MKTQLIVGLVVMMILVAWQTFIGLELKPDIPPYPVEITKDYHQKLDDPKSAIRSSLTYDIDCYRLDRHVIDAAQNGNLFDENFSPKERKQLFKCLRFGVSHPEIYYQMARAERRGYWPDTQDEYDFTFFLLMYSAASCGHSGALVELPILHFASGDPINALAMQLYLHRQGHQDWLYIAWLVLQSPFLWFNFDHQEKAKEIEQELTPMLCS